MAGPEKSDGAFRTIREVADWLGVPTHVLRFWESKFSQIAPVKGAGGRRYYRPEDMRLLGGIKVMLHDQGMPIRGVSQKIDEDGADAVMVLSPDLDLPDAAAAPRTRRVIRQREDDGRETRVMPAADAPARHIDGVRTPPPARPEPPGETTPPAEPDAETGAEPLAEPEVVAMRPSPRPEPEEPEPSQPGDELSTGQLGDETETPQPSDEPIEEPLDGSGQPDVPSTGRNLSKAPATDPETGPEPDIELEPDAAPEPDPDDGPDPLTEPEPTRPVGEPDGPGPAALGPAAPDLPVPDPATPGDPAAEADRSIHVPAANQRRLRRIIRKLRGLIEEVEGELREEARNGVETAQER